MDQLLASIDPSALLALAGVLVGGILTRGAAARDGRRSFNSRMFEREIEYITEITRTAEAQVILLGLIHQDLDEQLKAAIEALEPGTEATLQCKMNPALVKRMGVATEEWRRVMARRYVEGTALTMKALTHFDNERAYAVGELNAGKVGGDSLPRIDLALKGIHLAGGAVGAQLNCLTASDYFTGLEGFRLRRRAKHELRRAEERFEDWAKGALPEAEQETSPE